MIYHELDRNLEEQIRDLYFDRVMEIILHSPFRGAIGIYEERELLDKLLETEGVLHLSKPRPETLYKILRDFPTQITINIYL